MYVMWTFFLDVKSKVTNRLTGLHQNEKLLCFTRPPQESEKVSSWKEEIVENPLSSKGFVSRIDKEKSYNSKWKHNPIKNGQRNWTVFKEEIHMDNKHVKRWSASLVIRKWQITTRCHFMPGRMATIKRQVMTSVGKNVEKLEPSSTVNENAKWCSHFGNSLAVSQKVKDMTQQFHL